jgi:hypothetical protein
MLGQVYTVWFKLFQGVMLIQVQVMSGYLMIVQVMSGYLTLVQVMSGYIS